MDLLLELHVLIIELVCRLLVGLCHGACVSGLSCLAGTNSNIVPLEGCCRRFGVLSFGWAGLLVYRCSYGFVAGVPGDCCV